MRPIPAQGPCPQPMKLVAAARSPQPTKKRPCGRFVAVARPPLPITGPVIIGVGINVRRARDRSRRSDRTGGYASRKANGPGTVIDAGTVINAGSVVPARSVVAVVIAARRAHAISATQIVG